MKLGANVQLNISVTDEQSPVFGIGEDRSAIELLITRLFISLIMVVNLINTAKPNISLIMVVNHINTANPNISLDGRQSYQYS